MVSKYEVIANSVACISRDIQRLERAEMVKYGLKAPHAQCLLALSRYPEGLIATSLCELCEKDKAAVSRTVAELEDAGFVKRLERNGNRYRAALVLTEAGKEAAAAVSLRAKQAVELAGEGLTDGDREVFYRVLATIADNLHAICKNGLKET